MRTLRTSMQRGCWQCWQCGPLRASTSDYSTFLCVPHVKVRLVALLQVDILQPFVLPACPKLSMRRLDTLRQVGVRFKAPQWPRDVVEVTHLADEEAGGKGLSLELYASAF